MQTTSNEISTILGKDYGRCQSPSLRLEKFVRVDSKDKSLRPNEICAMVARHRASPRKSSIRWYGHGAIQFVASLEGNLIVNQAGGILENAGLCLNPFRGFPMIPGSALKGIARQAARDEWRSQPNGALLQRIARVFGYQGKQDELDKAIAELPNAPAALSGSVSFLAAVPLGEAKLTEDICTSHHPEYYQGKQQEPFDNEIPRPLVFPAVEKGASFLFQILPLRDADEQVMNDAKRWLLAGICDHGVGAKTAAGYGWFAYDEQTSQKQIGYYQAEIEREKQRQLEAIREAERKKREDEERARRKEREAALAARKATMSPDELADAELSDLSDEQFCTEVGKLKLGGRTDFSPKEKALVRALKGPRLEQWLRIKNLKKGKNTPNWPQVVNDIRIINKAMCPGEKMP